MQGFSKRARHELFVVVIVVVSLVIGFLLGRIDHGWKEKTLEVFTVVPPLVDWFHRMME